MNLRHYRFYLIPAVILIFLASCSEGKIRTITILATTDVHGVILPYDFIEKKDIDVSLAGVYTYVQKARKENEAVIVLDNGDNLQGQPEVYYYNFIDTVSPHLNAEAMNLIGYDAASVGNHDIEAGHSVYDRLAKKYNFPLLAANAVDRSTGNPYFKPYIILEKNGIRIAVLGLITPSVPSWLPPELYSGIEFRDLVETAGKWIPLIKKEKPDLIVGLFHSGWDEEGDNETLAGSHNEIGSGSVARQVPGFDIILCGHNHNVVNKKIVNFAGDTVLVMEGGSRSEHLMRADIKFSGLRGGHRYQKAIKGNIIDVKDYEADPDFTARFEGQKRTLNEYVDKTIATFKAPVSSRDSYFGPSAFVDLIHKIQLDITHADISFAAPLSFDVKIPAGPVTTGDMFKLYRFENMLYTMSMTGEEIKNYLEFSYSDWLNTMKGPGDFLLKFRLDKKGNPELVKGKAWLKNQPYNFDSAAGINYTVDVSKPEGKMVTIKSLSNGKPFEMDKTYLVAVNSYRANGGGGHFTDGAGINRDELAKRLKNSTDKDLRYYIMKYLESAKTIKPETLDNWKIIPEKWVNAAKSRDYQLLFGK
ncbi:MAG: bifunctional UDP-sugar hydrolase/5'-nucleotidase [Bacteroidota bacterium]|nr:bifunctional UDP-sugar hydrolase/5'-nucleotidase [Bacteroidota bacterium]